MTITDTLADLYVDDAAYERIIDALAELRDSLDALPQVRPVMCERLWAIELLGDGCGLWPASCLERADR